MDKSLLLEVAGDTIENRIIDFLIEGKGIDYKKKDIAEALHLKKAIGIVYKPIAYPIDGCQQTSITLGAKPIADNCGISRPTLYKIFPKLVKEKVIKLMRIIGKFIFLNHDFFRP